MFSQLTGLELFLGLLVALFVVAIIIIVASAARARRSEKQMQSSAGERNVDVGGNLGRKEESRP